MKMPAPVRVVLNHEEERTLSELLAAHEPQRTRDRAHMVRLNAQGWNAPAIAEMSAVSIPFEQRSDDGSS